MFDELALADWLGRHAVAGFGIVLPLLLGAVVVIWRLADHGGRLRVRRAWPDGAWLAPRLLLGFGFVLGAAGVFAEIADEIGAGETLGAFDTAFSEAIGRSLSTQQLRFFAVLTHLGDTVVLSSLVLVVAALLLLQGRRVWAFAWVAAVAGNALLNQGLKQVFERIRPVHEHGLVNEVGFSFPSGYTSGSLVAYGMLAYLVVPLVAVRWRLPIVLVAATLALATGASRVFLQVHFVSDVAAGLMSGGAWLAVCIGACEWNAHRVARRAA